METTTIHITSGVSHSLATFLLVMLCGGNILAQSSHEEEWQAKKKIIEGINTGFFTAIEKGNATAFAAQFTEDSWIMEPNATIYCGPGAPQDYFHDVLLKKGIAKGKFITVDLYGVGGEVMAEVGFYQFYNAAGDQFDDGKYIALWKNDGGAWKRFRETLVSSRP